MDAPSLPSPPFTKTAIQKVRRADIPSTADGGTARSSVNGREATIGYRTGEWQRELAYRLIKELWPSPKTAPR